MGTDLSKAIRATAFLHPFVAKTRQVYYSINTVIVIVPVISIYECDYKYGLFIM
jgi:hypothetical protein